MPLQKRIIPVIEIQGKRQVKTKQFKDPRYIGNPINSAKVFYEMGVHELAIIDITGTFDPNMLKRITKSVFIPVSYGGGIKSPDDATEVIQSGAEKVIINSAMTRGMIEETADQIGKQSVVISIDFMRSGEAYLNHGKTPTGEDVQNVAKDVVRYGAGELLIHSIDRDGEMDGYDLEITKKVAESVPVPVVALGGAGTRADLRSALDVGAWGAAAGSLFCYKDKRRAICLNYVDERIS